MNKKNKKFKGAIKSGRNDRFDNLIDPVIPAEAGIPGLDVSLFEPILLTSSL